MKLESVVRNLLQKKIIISSIEALESKIDLIIKI